MDEEQRQAITQVATILAYIDEELIKKVPEEVLMYIDENRSNSYYYDIDLSKPFDELELKEYTLVFLGWLSINYFCDSEEERNEIENVLKEHQIKYDSMIQTKFAPNGVLSREEMFEKNKETDESAENNNHALLAIDDEKNFISKMFDKLRKFFKKS